MIVDNEFLVNFDENFKEEESLLKENMLLIEDTSKAFEVFNLEAQNIIKNSFDVEKVSHLNFIL